jgi:dienelactone hydrolase
MSIQNSCDRLKTVVSQREQRTWMSRKLIRKLDKEVFAMAIGNPLRSSLCCLLISVVCSISHASTTEPDNEQEVVQVHQSAFEPVDFDSLETTGIFSPRPVRIKGYILKAKTDHKAPGAILAPACDGLLAPDGDRIRPNYRKMAKLLNSMGITVLLVDGFSPRGFKEICTQSGKLRSIDTTTRMKDSFGGLLYLRSMSDVKSNQIFLVTWGATGSFQSMNKASPYYEKMGAGFAAAVMFYPECEKVDYRFSPYAPIQMYVGEKDTWNPPGPCLILAKRQEPGSASFDIKIYPDTYHGFDQPRPPSLRTDAAVGPVITGGNPESAADAYQRTRVFLSRFLDIQDEKKATEDVKR